MTLYTITDWLGLVLIIICLAVLVVKRLLAARGRGISENVWSC
jgi:hypothetical protein